MEREGEVTGRNDETAEKNCETRAGEVVGDESAGHSSEVNGHRVGAVERCRVLHAESESALSDGRSHVKDQDRTHAVVTETFPQLGEKERAQTARVSQQAGAFSDVRF